MNHVRNARYVGTTMVALFVFLAIGCVNTVGDCTLVATDEGDTELEDGGLDDAADGAENDGMGGAGGMGGMGARFPETKAPKSKISRLPAPDEGDWRDNSILEGPVDTGSLISRAHPMH